MPEQVSPGPGWLPVVLVVLLLIPRTMVQEAIRKPGGWEPSPATVHRLAFLLLGLLAVAEALALSTLLKQLPTLKTGTLLFRAAGLIWAINVLVFALVYWEMDGGGPGHRALDTFEPDDFLFPQQTQENLNKGWSPEFLDYLFLAFNAATAFSPTDYDDPLAAGQGMHDGAVEHLAADHRAGSRARRQRDRGLIAACPEPDDATRSGLQWRFG